MNLDKSWTAYKAAKAEADKWRAVLKKLETSHRGKPA